MALEGPPSPAPGAEVGSGFFITFEGGEGSGKTTQIARLAERLRQAGHSVVTTREPGGSPGAEALRHVLLSGAAEAFGSDMEAILFSAARADHVRALIRPCLSAGQIVISDRFHDSTRVYQGTASQANVEMLAALERSALAGVYPDLTVILDVDAEEGLRRADTRRGTSRPDRFEKESLETHRLRRQAFLAIAAAEPERCVVVPADRDPDQVAQEIGALVEARLRAGGLRSEADPPPSRSGEAVAVTGT